MNEPLKDNSQRASNLKTVALIYLILTALGLIVCLYIRLTLSDFDFNSSESLSSLNKKLFVSSLFELIRIILFVINLVFFILWFKRAYYNIHTLYEKTEYSVNMAGYCWFIPILNLFVPYYIATEIISKTNRLFENDENEELRINRTPADIWWASNIVTGILMVIVNNFLDVQFSNNEEIRTYFTFFTIAFAIHFINTFGYINFINRYSNVESKLKNYENEDNIVLSSLTDNEV